MEILAAIGSLLAPWPLFLTLLGTVLGVLVGAIPGLNGAMLIALTLPFTFYMTPVDAMVLLVSMYTGTISGGLISAILLRIPGTPSNVITTFDGYPMAQRGEAGRALTLGITSSFVGAIIAWIALATITEPLSEIAIRLGPFDYFALVVTALVLIASVSEGSLLKGLLSGALGALAAFPGIDPSTGTERFTLGWWQITSGFDILPVLVGIFAVSTILSDVLGLARRSVVLQYRQVGYRQAFSDLRENVVNLLRSSLIGTWIGLLPGIGANIGSVVAWTTTRNLSRDPKSFGRGNPAGVVASESANNATVGGALIPLIALGIPGSVIDVFLIGAMMIHGIQPGPLLFTRNVDVVYAIIAACLLSSIAMLLFMLGSMPLLRRLLHVPKFYMLPVITVFCVIGVFASNNRWFEVGLMLAFGVLGFVMERARMPIAPFVIGFILTPLAEARLRSGLMITAGDVTPLFTGPFSAAMLLIAAILLLWPIVSGIRRRRLEA